MKLGQTVTIVTKVLRYDIQTMCPRLMGDRCIYLSISPNPLKLFDKLIAGLIEIDIQPVDKQLQVGVTI